MAASTITRITWTDDDGSGTTGTLINNSRKNSDIYAKIDEMFAGAGAYATFTFGGLISAEGFGTHALSASGAGAHTLIVRNSSASSAAVAEISIGNNSNSQAGRLVHTSSAYTPSAPFTTNSFNALGTQAGGMAVGSIHASGSLRLWGSSQEMMTLNAAAYDGVRIQGTVTAPGAAQTAALVNIAGTINAGGATSLAGLFVSATLGEFSSGTHGNIAGTWLQPPTVTAGGAAVTRASTLLVNGAPSASGADNLAIYVSSGQSGFPDGSSSAPALTFSGDLDTGFYRANANRIGASNALEFEDQASSMLASGTIANLSQRGVVFVASTGAVDAQGLTAGVNGQLVFIVNNGANTITLKHENGSATAADRFLTSGDADIALGAGEGVAVVYDGVSSRWICING